MITLGRTDSDHRFAERHEREQNANTTPTDA